MSSCLLCCNNLPSLCWYRMCRWHLWCLWDCRTMETCNSFRMWSRSSLKLLSSNCRRCALAYTQIIGLRRSHINLLLIAHDPKFISSCSCICEVRLRCRGSCTCQHVLTLDLLSTILELSLVGLHNSSHALLTLLQLLLLVHVPVSTRWLLILTLVLYLHGRWIIRKDWATCGWLHNSLISNWFRLNVLAWNSHLCLVLITRSDTWDSQSSTDVLLLECYCIGPWRRIRLSVVILVLNSFSALMRLRPIRMTPRVGCTAFFVISAFHF